MGGGGGGVGGEAPQTIYVRDKVQKNINTRKNPNKKIHAEDGPHFAIKPELQVFLKSVPKCTKWH